MRLGMVNWNACIPQPSYFGHYAARSLSEAAFHGRLPYYAQLDEAGQAVFPERTQADYDRELQYAIDAGIDYFAYCWYTDEPIVAPRNDCEAQADWSALNNARKMHQSSALRSQIGLCAIARTWVMTERDYALLTRAMCDECYERIDGRPLVYLFGQYESECVRDIEKIAAAATREGLPRPWFVMMDSGAALLGHDLTPLDGISGYAACADSLPSYSELAAHALELDKVRAGYGKKVIPLLTTGWDPMPRVVNPVPWIRYGGGPYAPELGGDDLAAAARAQKAWLDTLPAAQRTDHVMTFAWNEFEEGGWVCPTRSACGAADTTHLKAFARAAAILKEK